MHHSEQSTKPIALVNRSKTVENKIDTNNIEQMKTDMKHCDSNRVRSKIVLNDNYILQGKKWSRFSNLLHLHKAKKPD